LLSSSTSSESASRPASCRATISVDLSNSAIRARSSRFHRVSSQGMSHRVVKRRTKSPPPRLFRAVRRDRFGQTSSLLARCVSVS
jgi:hypothetical protein